MAKCAVGLNSLTVRVNMSNLQDRGANDKCTAEKAKRHPERMTCSLIGTHLTFLASITRKRCKTASLGRYRFENNCAPNPQAPSVTASTGRSHP